MVTIIEVSLIIATFGILVDGGLLYLVYKEAREFLKKDQTKLVQQNKIDAYYNLVDSLHLAFMGLGEIERGEIDKSHDRQIIIDFMHAYSKAIFFGTSKTLQMLKNNLINPEGKLFF